MDGPPIDFWGKLAPPEEPHPSAWHPLVDHCADVSACAEALFERTLLRRRLAALGGQDDLTPVQVARLLVFVAFHDVGKFNLGFQAKAEPGATNTAGHVSEVAALFDSGGPLVDRFLDALGARAWADWGRDTTLDALLFASICHHGRPVPTGMRVQPWVWREDRRLDPFEGIARLAGEVRRWFPLAFEQGGSPLPEAAAFAHAFSGLVVLADWLGSDRVTFPFSEPGDPERMVFSRSRARGALREMGLDPGNARESLSPRPPFDSLFGFQPRGAQETIERLEAAGEGSLVVLEAETGSGKTEAALARFFTLYARGEVDGLYFALPTRTAASQIHRRIVAAVERAFPLADARPPVVLAVPGYLDVDGRSGRRVPLLSKFDVLWDDSPDRFRYRAWAAENSKRFLAAPIAVGTIDQVLLSSLLVPHAHLRGTALLRQFLVVDELHASDSYMNRLLEVVLERHRDAGGHALLMSATLGTSARHRFLRRTAADPLPSLEEAIRMPFPAVSIQGTPQMIAVKGTDRTKRIRVIPWAVLGEPRVIAGAALDAAGEGAKVLVIRNTVSDCLETQIALEEEAANRQKEDLLFRCNGVPAPHHARYSRDDRLELDRAIEEVFGKHRPDGGCVAIATQTVQQSLDLDADWLLTDLCPIDVLLQRIGRLHRHAREDRSARFISPTAHVLIPHRRDLGSLIRPSGKATGRHGLGTVYEDLRILEATLRLVESRSEWSIPRDNRELVESATHPEALRRLAAELGPPWDRHEMKISGGDAAKHSLAAYNSFSWTRIFGEEPFPPRTQLERRISTRLGEGDRRAVFSEPKSGPFGNDVVELSLPAHFAADAEPDSVPVAIESGPGELRFAFGQKRFIYDKLGLRPDERTMEDDLADA